MQLQNLRSRSSRVVTLLAAAGIASAAAVAWASMPAGGAGVGGRFVQPKAGTVLSYNSKYKVGHGVTNIQNPSDGRWWVSFQGYDLRTCTMVASPAPSEGDDVIAQIGSIESPDSITVVTKSWDRAHGWHRDTKQFELIVAC